MTWEASLVTGIVMLLGNAFFVGAEFGLVSARRSTIELAALEGSRRAQLTLQAMEQVSMMLVGAQLGITLCSLIFGAVSEPMVAHALEGPFHSLGLPAFLIEPTAVLIALILMVYLHVVIGEMVPKNLALAAPAGVALWLTPPLLFIVKMTRPFIVALNAIANACLRLFGVHPRQEVASSFTRDEVAGFIKESHQKGLLSLREQQLLSGALQLDVGNIRSVLIPLDKVIFASDKPTPEEIEELTQKTGFSRFPVRGGKDEPQGYIHLKDVLQIPEDKQATPLPSKLIRPITSIKDTATLRDALSVMQQSGAHIARVATLEGEIIGIVALEDVLEKLVGEIRDDSGDS